MILMIHADVEMDFQDLNKFLMICDDLEWDFQDFDKILMIHGDVGFLGIDAGW